MPKLVCENPKCGRIFIRRVYKISKHNYCSCSCSVTVSNKTHPRNPGIVKICAYCGKKFKSREKYCGRVCKDRDIVISKQEIIGFIREFVNSEGRIPYKWEYRHYHAARLRFETWNKAIEKAGYIANPVRFANKHIAIDGHKCDSLAERIIDDYLFRRNIKHERNHPYPGDKGFTVDFKVGDNWIEFFGLKGEYKRYDQLLRRKLNLVKEYNLKLLSIYPKDLFPKGNLESVLNTI